MKKISSSENDFLGGEKAGIKRKTGKIEK